MAIPAVADVLVPGDASLRADSHPAAVYLARLASGSRPTMRTALATIVRLASSGTHTIESFPWASLRYAHTAALRARLAEQYAATGANKILAALRGVLQEAWRLGMIGAEDYRRAVDIKPVRGSTVPAGRALGGDELGALARVCAADGTAAGVRDRALVAVLYAGGLRRSEAVALDLADYDVREDALTVRAGKGNKGRMVYVPAAREQLAAWLQTRGGGAGALFCPVNKAGRVTVRRMTAQSVRAILQRRGAEAGLAHFTPHDLRRTNIGDLLDAGADLPTVQALAGHRRPETTARYDRRGERARRKAAALLPGLG